MLDWRRGRLRQSACMERVCNNVVASDVCKYGY